MTFPGSGDATRFHELDADYEIIRELGRGATAVVYLARERELAREVAIKVLRSNQADAAEAMARLAREAKLVALLRHPNIVPLLSTRHLSDGGLALIMQHVPGRTLKSILRDEGTLPVPLVEQILREIGLALDYAHRRHNIVHRDIKPENIYLDEECGHALLADFGIARAGEAESSLTLVGTALGTPAYMSPEQIDGVPLDGRSDLYSLGLVAYEMLTGKQPWAGSNLYTIIYKQKHENLPPVTQWRSDVPAYLEQAIARLLCKDRSERWSDAAHFVAQLPRTQTAVPPLRASKQAPAVSAMVEDDSPTLKYDRSAAPPAPFVAPATTTSGDEAEPAPAAAQSPAAWEFVEDNDGAADAVPAEDAPQPVAEPIVHAPVWERVERSPGRSYSIKKEPVAAVLPVERPRAEEWGDTGVAAFIDDDLTETLRPRILAALQSHKSLRLLAAAGVFLVISVTATIVALLGRTKDPDLHANALPAIGAPVARWDVGNDTVTESAAVAEDSAVTEIAEKTKTTTVAMAPAPEEPKSKQVAAERTERPEPKRAEPEPIAVPSLKAPDIPAVALSRRLTDPEFSMGQSAAIPTKSSVNQPVADIDAAPVYTTYTVPPELRNREEVQRALERNYPRRLRESGTGGTVTLWALIDERGNVVRSQVKSGSGIDVLDRAAMKVADAMHFTPAANQDQPVRVWVELPMVFKTK